MTHRLEDFPPEKRDAWRCYLAGQAVPIADLPRNGENCAACKFPLFIDGTCPNSACVNSAHHLEDPDITDDMLDAALAEFPDELVHTVAPFIAQAIEAALRAREDTS